MAPVSQDIHDAYLPWPLGALALLDWHPSKANVAHACDAIQPTRTYFVVLQMGHWHSLHNEILIGTLALVQRSFQESGHPYLVLIRDKVAQA